MTDYGPQTCVILAGGLGTRLRGVISDRPKCLAPVRNRTFLDLQLACLAEAGVTDVVLALGYGADQVLASLEPNKPRLPTRHVIEPEQLGTGGAVSFAMDAFSLDEILVANGDTYLAGDFSSMFAPLNRGGCELFRVATVQVPDRSRFGGVMVDSTDRILGFLEKGHTGSGIINAGLYRLCRAALPEDRSGAYSLETEVLPGLVSRGLITARAIQGSFIDIGVPADYQRFCDNYAT